MTLCPLRIGSSSGGRFELLCRIGEWKQTLDADDVREFDRYLDEGGSMAGLWAECRSVGLGLKLTAFKDHERGRCRCD